MSEPVVRVIRANPFNKPTSQVGSNPNILKVAAYARVSTDHEEQEDSFERQVEYYTHFICSNPSWEFIKVYSDPGISGTRADKRPGFQEMIRDCKKGLINRILVKSIARFARNTVDCLKYIRELKEIGVSVFFEAQNIDTLTPGGDILLTLLAASAEEESRTISKNIRWAYQKKFEKGDFIFDYTHFLGLTRDENGKVVIVEEEARVVKRIYKEFLNGHSLSGIANGLERDGILTPFKKTKWYYGTVRSILTNEKYYGAVRMGKTFKPDVLSKRMKNEGQVESYYAENVIPPIIDKTTWDMVQKELKDRMAKSHIGGTYQRFCSKYPFSKMIKCGTCGAYFVRSTNMRKDGQRIASWWCKNRRKKDSSCDCPGISEKAIEGAFLKVLKESFNGTSEINSVLKASVKASIKSDPSNRIEEINDLIDNLQSQMLELHKQKSINQLTEMEYALKGQTIANKIDAYRKEIQNITETNASNSALNKRIEDITNVIDTISSFEEFDEDVFKKIIEEIIVHNKHLITFRFKVGFDKQVRI